MNTLLLFLLLLQTGAEGVEQAILYSRRGAEAFKWDEHIIYILRRGLIVACIVLVYLVGIRIDLILVIACYLLMFSLIHNECYYFTRHQIDPSQPYKFGYQSPTTTAKFDMNGWIRTTLAGIGIGLYVLDQLFNFTIFQ